jgi:TonB family protein
MRRQRRWWVLVLACGAGLLADVAAAAPGAPGAARANRLQAFYVRGPGNGTAGSEDLIGVEAVGPDVRVRLIRVRRVDDFCPNLIVEAVEGMLPHTTVQAVAGVGLCSLPSRQVRLASARAQRHYSTVDFFGSVDAIVADCDRGARSFVLTQPPILDDRALRRQAPEVAALWNTASRVGNRITTYTFRDPDAPFRAAPAASEALGTALVPELLSERYVRLLPDYLVKDLKHYTGPPAHRGMYPPDVIDRESLGITTYVAPIMPRIALSARVFGDIRLRLTVDAETGEVKAAQVLSGPPLLSEPAIRAARQWRFAPATAPREPIVVTVSFTLRCPPA